jgi:hypothetical protein
MGIGSMVAGAALGAAKGALDAKAELKRRLMGRTPEQQEVIKYFLKGEGCISKNMTDGAYETLVRNRVTSGNFKQKALDKIGIDESQVNEIPPVYFEGYLFDFAESLRKGEDILSKLGKDNVWRSPSYQISYLFFSNTQVHVYQFTFNMDGDEKKETTEEYFYKDITNFSTTSDTAVTRMFVEKGGCLGIGSKAQLLQSSLDTERFALAAAGGKFYCSMSKKEDTEGAIQAMKAKLREKKQ